MPSRNTLNRAAHLLKRISLGLGSAAICVALTQISLPWPAGVSVAGFGVALALLLALCARRPTLKLERPLVVCAVLGSLGGISLLVASRILEIGGAELEAAGAALLPIGGAAAGTLAIFDPGGPHRTGNPRWRVAGGLALLVIAIATALRWTAVDWLSILGWVLPVLVLAAASLVSAARMVENQPRP